MPSDAINDFFVELNNAAAEVAYSLAVGEKPEFAFIGSEDAESENIAALMQSNFSFKCNFSGITDGRAIFILPEGFILSVGASLMGSGKSKSVQAAEKSAVFEMMNSLVLRWAAELTKLFESDISVENPEIMEPGSEGPAEGEAWYKGNFGVTVGSEDYKLSACIPMQIADLIDSKLSEQTPVETEKEPAPHKEPTPQEKPVTPPKPSTTVETREEKPAGTSVNVKQAQFQQLQADVAESAQERPIDLILDVPLLISVELGRKELTIKEILELSPGSLIELNQLAGEPVDLLINGKLFARGEVVVIDENFGIRVTHIISPQERVEKLR